MKTSSIRLIRKIAGIVLIVINTLLSIMSALAMYSIVEFASNANNYKFQIADPIDYDFTISPNGYINLGNVSINNTGIFAFEDFELRFEFSNTTNDGSVKLLSYNGTLADVKAGEIKVLPLILKNDTSTGSEFWVNPVISTLTGIDAANVTGFLQISGRYVLSLFRFDFSFRNLTTWSWI